MVYKNIKVSYDKIFVLSLIGVDTVREIGKNRTSEYNNIIMKKVTGKTAAVMIRFCSICNASEKKQIRHRLGEQEWSCPSEISTAGESRLAEMISTESIITIVRFDRMPLPP